MDARASALHRPHPVPARSSAFPRPVRLRSTSRSLASGSPLVSFVSSSCFLLKAGKRASEFEGNATSSGPTRSHTKRRGSEDDDGRTHAGHIPGMASTTNLATDERPRLPMIGGAIIDSTDPTPKTCSPGRCHGRIAAVFAGGDWRGTTAPARLFGRRRSDTVLPCERARCQPAGLPFFQGGNAAETATRRSHRGRDPVRCGDAPRTAWPARFDNPAIGQFGRPWFFPPPPCSTSFFPRTSSPALSRCLPPSTRSLDARPSSLWCVQPFFGCRTQRHGGLSSSESYGTGSIPPSSVARRPGVSSYSPGSGGVC